MIGLGLSGKRAVVSSAGYIPERAGHGWFTSLAVAEAGASVARIDVDSGARIALPARSSAGEVTPS